MSTYLFTWNPNKWTWTDLPQAVSEANSEGYYYDRWSCGSTRSIRPDDRAFLMRLGVPPKGLIGSGIITSEPYEGLHWDRGKASRGEMVYRVDILFDVLNEIPILDEHDLSSGELENHDWFPQSSGTRIPDEIAVHLESAWSEATGIPFAPLTSEDLRPVLVEGGRRRHAAIRYERNPEARRRCVQHYGPKCWVCGLRFEQRYGDIGAGFIHVHHVTPLSGIDEKHEIDPVKDLRPVCPNCHAMLHRRRPPYTIEDMKSIMNTPKNLS